jgi:hypothetical protein
VEVEVARGVEARLLGSSDPRLDGYRDHVDESSAAGIAAAPLRFIVQTRRHERIRHLAMTRRRNAFETALAWALVFFAAVTAALPHSHNVAAELSGAAAIAQPACLHHPAVTHFDAVETGHEHPCLACERQHQNGPTTPVRILVAPDVKPEDSTFQPVLIPARREARALSLRGPPESPSC